MNGHLVCGIDPSTTCTGYVAPNGTIHSIVPPQPRMSPIEKRNHVRNGLRHIIRLHPPTPTLAVIEGYSIASPSRWGLVHRGELGGMLRDVLYEMAIIIVEVPPKSLKLFASGDGTANKTLMTYCANSVILHDGDHGQRFCANDDEADAWHLRRMGMVALGQETALAEYQTQAVTNCGVDWHVL